MNYAIIPEGLGMIAASSGLRAQRSDGSAILPRPEGMTTVHTNTHYNNEENNSAQLQREQDSYKTLQRIDLKKE